MSNSEGYMMKIHRIIWRLPPHAGGMEQHALIISQLHALWGHQTTVFFEQGDVVENDLLRAVQLPGPKIRVKPEMLHEILVMFKYLKASYRFEKPDIIHTHGGLMMARMGAWFADYFGALHCHSLHGQLILGRFRNALWRYGMKGIDHVFCVSDAISKKLTELGCSSVSTRTSGFYKDVFYPLVVTEDGPPWKLVTVGRMSPLKGFGVLLECCRKLVASGLNFELSMIGDGPLKSEYQEYVSRYNLPVIFWGHLSSQEIASVLRQSHLFVLSSVDLKRQAEGTPTVLLEAMASGVPIVATITGGVANLIHNEINGLLVPPNDSVALASAINRLIADEPMRLKMKGTNVLCSERFTWECVAEEIISKYEDLL